MLRLQLVVLIIAVIALAAARPQLQKRENNDHHWEDAIGYAKSIIDGVNVPVDLEDIKHVKQKLLEDLRLVYWMLGDLGYTDHEYAVSVILHMYNDPGFQKVKSAVTKEIGTLAAHIKDHIYDDQCNVCDDNQKDIGLDCVLKRVSTLIGHIEAFDPNEDEETIKGALKAVIATMFETMVSFIKLHRKYNEGYMFQHSADSDEHVGSDNQDTLEHTEDNALKNFYCHHVKTTSPPPPTTTTTSDPQAKKRGYERRQQLENEILRLLRNLKE